MFLGFSPRIPGVSEDPHHVLERTLPTDTPSLPTCPPPAQRNSTSPLQQPPQVGFHLCYVQNVLTFGKTPRRLGATPPDLDSPGELSGHFFLLLFFFLDELHSIHSPLCTRTALPPSFVLKAWKIKTEHVKSNGGKKTSSWSKQTCITMRTH